MKSIHWKYQKRMLMSEEDSITENQIEKKESVTKAFTKLVNELKQFEINNQKDYTNLSKVAKSLLNDLEKLRSTWSDANE